MRSASGPAAEAPAPRGSDALFAALYDELRRLARRETARLGAQAVSSATTLLHEAWLSMAGRGDPPFASQGAFLAYAARAMRSVAIDRARERDAQKRGGGLDITSLDTELGDQVVAPDRLDRIAEALDALAVDEPELAAVVDLKFFCGLTVDEIAALHGVSERTVRRQWEKARLLLFRALAP